MKIALNIAILMWGMASVLASKKIYQRWINAVSIFCGVWSVVSICSLFGAFGFYVPQVRVYVYVLIIEIAFGVSVFFLKVIRSKFSLNNSWFGQRHYAIRFNINLWFLVIVVMCVPLMIKSLSFWSVGNIKGLRSSYLAAKNGYLGFWGTYMYLYFIRPLIGVISLAAISRIPKEEDSKIKNFVIALVLSCVHVIISGGRKELFNLVIYILLANFIIGNKGFAFQKRILSFKKRKTSTKIVSFLVLVSISFIISITARRLYFNQSIIGTLWQYAIGPMGYLDVIISHPKGFAINSSALLCGKAILGWITIPFDTVWALFSKRQYRGADYLLGRYSNKFYYISPSVKLNATETIIYTFIRDFGVAGLVIDSIILGIFVSFIEKCREKYKTEVWDCLLISVYFMLGFSTWRYAFNYVEGAMMFFYLVILALLELITSKFVIVSN